MAEEVVGRRKYTSKIEYYYKILKALKICGMVKKIDLQKILSVSNYDQIAKYVDLLEDAKCVEVVPDNEQSIYHSKAKFYRITNIGQRYVDMIEDVEGIIKSLNPIISFRDEESAWDLTDENDQNELYRYITKKNKTTRRGRKTKKYIDG